MKFVKEALRAVVVASAVLLPPLLPGGEVAFSQDRAGGAASAVTVEATDTAPFRAALLRHRPVFRYDFGEVFFPVRVEAITNNEGNRLEREEFNELLAERRNRRGLSIRYLRPGTYPTPGGDPVLESDRVNERGNEVHEYREDVAQFQRLRSPYSDAVYGRIFYLRDGGRITGAWLQYWTFYYYNDFPGIEHGDHEGDWEMVQVKVDAQGRPVAAAYASHGGGQARDWGDVERVGRGRTRPVVYVALGSHAAYFEARPCNQDRHVDGRRTRPRSRLLTLGSRSARRWLAWPGAWGGSGSSPQGPRSQGNKWSDPEGFYREVRDNRCLPLSSEWRGPGPSPAGEVKTSVRGLDARRSEVR